MKYADRVVIRSTRNKQWIIKFKIMGIYGRGHGLRYTVNFGKLRKQHYHRGSKYGKLCLLLQYFGNYLAKLFVAYTACKRWEFWHEIKNQICVIIKLNNQQIFSHKILVSVLRKYATRQWPIMSAYSSRTYSITN